MRRRSHWGWGYEDEWPSPGELRAAAAGLAAHLGFGAPEPEQPVRLEAVELPAPRVALPQGLPLSDDPHARALHAHGRSYLDVVRGFRGRFPHPPDAVAAPRDEQQLLAVLEWAAREDLAVIPAGGGTSVVGGIDARPGGHGGAVTLSLRALDRVLDVDVASRAARIQAGASGPELERRLGEHGLTLRFFPQSFELATLGGWLATRAAGHFATGPTHVDDLVESIRAITATGETARLRVGRRAARRAVRARRRALPRARTLVAIGVLSETFESAITWDRLDGFVERVIGATRAALGPDGLVTVRLTHAYPDGAAPYFTVVAPVRRGDEEEQWHAIKHAAADAILAAGGTITHHHAVGRDHLPWYDRQRPDPFAAALRAAKSALDPDARLNPGLLLDP